VRDSQGGRESYPTEGVRRRCMKNSPSVISCIGKRTKEGCDRGSEVGIVHSGQDFVLLVCFSKLQSSTINGKFIKLINIKYKHKLFYTTMGIDQNNNL